VHFLLAVLVAGRIRTVALLVSCGAVRSTRGSHDSEVRHAVINSQVRKNVVTALILVFPALYLSLGIVQWFFPVVCETLLINFMSESADLAKSKDSAHVAPWAWAPHRRTWSSRVSEQMIPPLLTAHRKG
jgi:hypothetical protein